MDITVKIPSWNRSKFEKYIKSLQRKGLDVEVEDLGKAVETVKNTDYMCNAYSIKNETLYQVNGWKFIGTLEHKENGNIIRKAVDVAVPQRYETAPCECEHCHTVRKRIDTYLVMGPDGEFKQVGKSCLKGYTGMNPAICALAMDLEAELEKLEIDEEEVSIGGFNSFGAYRGFEGDRLKKVAYNEIKNNGYKKDTIEAANGKIIQATKFEAIDLYNMKNPSMASDAEIEEVDAWVDGLDQYNDYFRNASLAYKEKYYETRDLGLVVSLIAYYFKNKQIETEKAAKEKARLASVQASQEVGYLGEVGAKVEFEVASDYILFRNTPYAYGGSWSYTHKIIDTEGHVILWSTSADTSRDNIFPEGTTIKATVKAHKEFRGELQTVVTRGKANMPELIISANEDDIDF